MMHEGTVTSARIVAGKCGNDNLQAPPPLFCVCCLPRYLILHFAPILLSKPLYTHYRNCKDVVGDDHEQGKNDVCLDYLGGWD
jgi:hypothetical protein